MSAWIVIVGVALVTFGMRASFVLFVDPNRFPEGFRRALVFVPPAVLAAFVTPGLFAPQGFIDLGVTNLRWIAGAVAILVALRTRSVVFAIAGGMVALWLLQWVLRAFV